MNTHLPSSRRRRSIRLRGFDYARAGAYFVTICAHQRENLFGEIVAGELHRSPLGEIVLTEWAALPGHYPRVHLDSFVLMPNHLHGILWLQEVPAQPETGARSKVPSHQLSEIVRGLKALTTRRARERGHPSASPVWQRGYHERIVRGEGELTRIREYIDQNLARWAEDREHVGATRGGFEICPYTTTCRETPQT